MFNFSQKLLPRQEDFFGQFDSHSKALVSALFYWLAMLVAG